MGPTKVPALHLSTFTADVTPPLGHPLCGGWIEPVRAVDEALEARGVVLLGMGRPVVLCAVDWCGLRNEAFDAWRRALAEAVHTVAANVAVHCVHAHNAPFADLEAERLLEAVPGAPRSLGLPFFERVVRRTAAAARASLARTEALTHVGTGRARVESVASNRRILGPDGRVKYVRYSATKDAKVRHEPEGLIDPWLRTVSFWGGERPLAALHYYATHPMSYYGDGRVTSDFCGLARAKRQADEPRVFQIYFTGCAGNVAAGKYNDGSPANRPVLRDRIYGAMKEAWKDTRRCRLDGWRWAVEPLTLSPRRESAFGEEASRRVMEDARQTKAARVNAAFQRAWLRRIARPVEITCLNLGPARILHLPGEPFVEYQLKAQALRPERFVCVAGYGDGGPGYVPTDRAFFEGGYEPTVALAGPCERTLGETIARVMKD